MITRKINNYDFYQAVKHIFLVKTLFFCRFQWELQNAPGNKQITRVNADVKLLWDLKGDIQQVRCEIPKFGSPPTTGHCPARPKPIVDTVGRQIHNYSSCLNLS